MVLCPRCGSPRLNQCLVFDHPEGTVSEQKWRCGCGWEGLWPNRVRGSLLINAYAPTKKVKKFTKAMRDLQGSGDMMLILNSDGTKEILT